MASLQLTQTGYRPLASVLEAQGGLPNRSAVRRRRRVRAAALGPRGPRALRRPESRKRFVFQWLLAPRVLEVMAKRRIRWQL